jgi:NADPH-dependent 2,4-dienoyl-CoA reductase/sulfur reductase-like enzyme
VPENDVVIIGGGLAGFRVATELRRLGHSGSVSVAAEEGSQPYDRPPLSKKALTNGATREELALPGVDRADIEVLEDRAEEIGDGVVRFSSGRVKTWTTLVLATGAEPIRPPFVPNDPRVHLLRTFEDSQRLRSAMETASSVTVVGGGFIGTEVASSATDMGLKVCVVETQPMLLPRALGPFIASEVKAAHQARGVDLRLCAPVTNVVVDPSPEGPVTVELGDGSHVMSDLLVVGVGVRPRTDIVASYASANGLTLVDGVPCDESGSVDGLPDVWAVGDVAAWRRYDGRRQRQEHWSSAADQAAIVAHRIAGAQPPAFLSGPPYFWSDQVGKKLQTFGHLDMADANAVASRDDDGLVVNYLCNRELVAVATFGAPKLLAAHRRKVAESLSRRRDLIATATDGLTVLN